MNKQQQQQATSALQKLKEEEVLGPKVERVRGKEARVSRIKDRWEKEHKDLVKRLQDELDLRNRLEKEKDDKRAAVAARIKRELEELRRRGEVDVGGIRGTDRRNEGRQHFI